MSPFQPVRLRPTSTGQRALWFTVTSAWKRPGQPAAQLARPIAALCPFENFINPASHRLTLASEPFAPSCRFSKASFLFSRRCGALPPDTPGADHAAGPGHLGSLQPLANEGTCRSLRRHFILFLLSEYVLKFLGHMLRVFQPTWYLIVILCGDDWHFSDK